MRLLVLLKRNLFAMHGHMNVKKKKLFTVLCESHETPKDTLCAQCRVLTLEQVVRIWGFSNYDATTYLVEASRSGVVLRLCPAYAASYIDIFLISYAR